MFRCPKSGNGKRKQAGRREGNVSHKIGGATVSINAVSANLRMSVALRIREEAMDMNVSLSSHISNLIEEALSARDSRRPLQKVHDPDFDNIPTIEPDFDTSMFDDGYTKGDGLWAWIKYTFWTKKKVKMGKVIAEGEFGADPEETLKTHGPTEKSPVMSTKKETVLKQEMDKLEREVAGVKSELHIPRHGYNRIWSDEEIIEAVKKTKGNVAQAALLIGMGIARYVSVMMERTSL